MSYEKFLKLGADVVNGEVFLDHVLMGRCTADGFELTPAGEALLAPPPKKPKAKAEPSGGAE